MPLEDLLISTGVDNLIKLVHEKGSVEVKEAARLLRLPQATIEDWAHVLEAEGVVKIEYRLTQIHLVWAYLNEDRYAKTTEKVQTRKSDTIQKLQTLNQTLEAGIADIGHLKEGVDSLDLQNRARLERVSSDKGEVERLHAQLDDTLQLKRASIDEMKTEMDQLGGEMDALSQALSAAPEGGAAGDVGAKIGTLAALQSRLEDGIVKSEAETARLYEQMRALQAARGTDPGDQELGTIKNGIAELQYSKTELAKAMQSMLAEVKSLDNQVRGLDARLDDISKKRGTGAAQKKTMEKLEAAINESLKAKTEGARDMRSDLEIVRKQIEVLSHSQYQYQSIQAHLGSLRAQFQRESEDIGKLSESMENAQEKYSGDLDTARQNLEEQEGKYRELEQKSQAIREVLERLERLKGEGEALSSKLKGIIKEAQVVQMAAPVGVSASASAGTEGGETGGMNAMDAPGRPASSAPSPRENNAAFSGHTQGAASDESLPPGLMQRIALTAGEEEEFDKKRNELRSLIEKMWNEDRRPHS